jgi:hypothetical protein
MFKRGDSVICRGVAIHELLIVGQQYTVAVDTVHEQYVSIVGECGNNYVFPAYLFTKVEKDETLALQRELEELQDEMHRISSFFRKKIVQLERAIKESK